MEALILACALCSVVQARAEVVGARLAPDEVRRIATAVTAAEAAWRVPAGVLLAVIEHESRYDADAVGGGHDFGLMQVRRKTAHEVARVLAIKTTRFRELRHNVLVGAAYLHILQKRFRDWAKALTAYNRGPRVFVQDGRVVNNYARRVLQRRVHIRRLLRKVPKTRS